MTIRYAILGLLNQQPRTGYDLKKAIANSSILHWSGNNNQIYTILLQLHKEGLVEIALEEKGDHSTRKIYHISPLGQADLQKWLATPPVVPDLKNHFLIQFLFLDQNSDDELFRLLDQYEDELNLVLAFQQEEMRRNAFTTTGTLRRKLINQQAAENLINHTRCEINWVSMLRQTLTT